MVALPTLLRPSPRAPTVGGVGDALRLDDAVEHTRTGDLWLFRGRALADRLIQVSTNSPVNHVGLAVVIDDLPPLLWHADAGRPLRDAWSLTWHGGAQLHHLRHAVVVWARRRGQQAWLRQLDLRVDRATENALLRTIGRLDGVPYPSLPTLVVHRLRARVAHALGFPRADVPAGLDCAQVVALAYEAMGLLPAGRSPASYDPGRFWSGDGLRLARGAALAPEIEVEVPRRADRLARTL